MSQMKNCAHHQRLQSSVGWAVHCILVNGTSLDYRYMSHIIVIRNLWNTITHEILYNRVLWLVVAIGYLL